MKVHFCCKISYERTSFFYVHVTRKSCQNVTFVQKILTFNIDEIDYLKKMSVSCNIVITESSKGENELREVDLSDTTQNSDLIEYSDRTQISDRIQSSNGRLTSMSIDAWIEKNFTNRSAHVKTGIIIFIFIFCIILFAIFVYGLQCLFSILL